MVGDTLNADIAGAHAAGMRAILITTGETKPNGEHHPPIIPDANISALSQLPELLERWKT